MKNPLHYLKGTKKYGLIYTRDGKSHKLEIYVDVPWANDIDTRRSTTGIVAYLGNHLIDYSSKSQSLVKNSTLIYSYVAADSVARMLVCLTHLLTNLVINQDVSTIMHEDNVVDIILSIEERKFIGTKQNWIYFHYLREKIDEG